MTTPDVVFLSGVRTGFGAFGGALKDLSATDLGVVAGTAALERSGLGADADRSRRLRQRAADLGRRHLPRAPRGAPERAADRDAGGHREPALRLGLRGDHPGGAADPAGRVARGAGRRRRVDEPGAARGARRALGAPARAGAAARGLALGGAAATRSAALSMAETAENLADKYGIDRAEVDAYALAEPAARQGGVGGRRVRRRSRAGAAHEPEDEAGRCRGRADEHMRPDTTRRGAGQAGARTSRRTAW